MDGKNISKWAIIISIIFALVIFIVSILMNRKIPTPEETTSILMISGFILICGSPIYISIWIDKIFGKSVAKLPNDTTDAVGQDVPHDPDAGDNDPEFPVEVPQKQTCKCGFTK